MCKMNEDHPKETWKLLITKVNPILGHALDLFNGTVVALPFFIYSAFLLKIVITKDNWPLIMCPFRHNKVLTETNHHLSFLFYEFKYIYFYSILI